MSKNAPPIRLSDSDVPLVGAKTVVPRAADDDAPLLVLMRFAGES